MISVSNFIEMTLRQGCPPVNLLHILRTPFIKNTSGWLLLIHSTKIHLRFFKGTSGICYTYMLLIRKRYRETFKLWIFRRTNISKLSNMQFNSVTRVLIPVTNATQKRKFSIKDFFSECDQIRLFGHIY